MDRAAAGGGAAGGGGCCWAVGQPDDQHDPVSGEGEACGATAKDHFCDATWHDEQCSTPYAYWNFGYVCEKVVSSAAPPPAAAGTCAVTLGGQSLGGDWTYSEGECYKAFCAAATWADAERHCTELGAHLAKIASCAQNAAVRGLVTGARMAWIGTHKPSGYGQAAWINADGTVLTPAPPWYRGEPDNRAGLGEYCVAMGHGDHPGANDGWFDAQCCQRMPYVCSRPAVTAAASAEGAGGGAACPAGTLGALTWAQTCDGSCAACAAGGLRARAAAALLAAVAAAAATCA